MKKPTKILLTFLLITIASIGALIYLQQDNLSAIINSMKYSPEDIAIQLDTNREKLKSEVEKYTAKSINDITAEDEQKLLNGKLSLEEVADKYNLPIEYMVENDESENVEDINKQNIIPENDKEIESDSNKITTSNKQPNTDEINDVISESISKMYALKAKYVNKLGELEREVYKTYTSLPKEKQNKDNKYNIIMENMEYAADLEEKCDNEVYEVISELKTELNKLSGDTEIINILEDAYEEEKELKKSYYLSLYNE